MGEGNGDHEKSPFPPPSNPASDQRGGMSHLIATSNQCMGMVEGKEALPLPPLLPAAIIIFPSACLTLVASEGSWGEKPEKISLPAFPNFLKVGCQADLPIIISNVKNYGKSLIAFCKQTFFLRCTILVSKPSGNTALPLSFRPFPTTSAKFGRIQSRWLHGTSNIS